MSKTKVYYFAPHPVPYHTGIYREVAKIEEENSFDFKVIYEDTIGLTPVYVEDYKKEIKWEIDLLGGYKKEFIKILAPIQWVVFLQD